MVRFPSSRAIGALCLSALLAGAAPMTVAAQSVAAPRAISAVHIPGTSITFDWLSQKRASGKRTVADAVLLSSDDQGQGFQSRYFGHGSYICSPAGFGKKSRCFAR